MSENQKRGYQTRGYRVAEDQDGVRYIRLYLDSFEDLEKIAKVDITFFDQYKPVYGGKLYSHQHLKSEKKRMFDDGWSDGYEKGMQAGFDDGWIECEKFIKQQEIEKQEKEEKARLERSRRVAIGGGRKQALNDEQKAQIRALHEKGKSYREIERLIGYKASYVTIGKVVKGEL